MHLLYVLPSLSSCVSEHQNFVILPYGKTLKIDLIINSSLVQLYYRPDNGPKSYLLMDNGEFTTASGTSYFYRTIICALLFLYEHIIQLTPANCKFDVQPETYVRISCSVL